MVHTCEYLKCRGRTVAIDAFPIFLANLTFIRSIDTFCITSRVISNFT